MIKIPAFLLVQSLVTWANGGLSLEESQGLIQLTRKYLSISSGFSSFKPNIDSPIILETSLKGGAF